MQNEPGHNMTASLVSTIRRNRAWFENDHFEAKGKMPRRNQSNRGISKVGADEK
jgi:hypothetical protein